MKKQLVLILAVGILFVFFQSFRPEPASQGVFPDEIATVLKTSCHDCHFTGARSEKAVNTMNFDTWDSYRTTKKIGLLSDIAKMVEERKMPPGKYLENKPGAELSEQQIKMLTEWTQAEAEKLMQGN